jgi:trimethylamine--corrinoid protein Co-methyltransferase
MVVLANEMIDQLSAYSNGIEVTEKTLAMEVIKAVGQGGHYLNEKHTLKNFRSVWYPEFFKRRMVNPNQSDVMTMVNAKIDGILSSHVVPSLDPVILAEIEKIEKQYI